MNKNSKKLTLNKSTFRILTLDQLDGVAGGTATGTCDELNPQPLPP
jgi:hypothetical protein